MIPTALITGASRGIGLEIASSLKSTHHLILVSRDLEKLQKIKKQLSSHHTVEIMAQDLSQELPLDFTNHLSSRSISVYVHAAGQIQDELFIKSSHCNWNALMNTNLFSCMKISQCLLKNMMKKRQGCIIPITSIVGTLKGNKGQCLYSVSKAGLVGFTKSLDQEMGPKGIRINAIAPGYIDTDLIQHLDKASLVKQIPLQRLGSPKDIVPAVHYLLNAHYVNGQVIVVDGGLC